MSMPIIPDINLEININRQDAVNIIIASIAMEELALAHILNAEGGVDEDDAAEDAGYAKSIDGFNIKNTFRIIP